MAYVQIIGFVAATFTTGCLVPQVIKSHKTRSTGDLSVTMFLAMVTGVFLWLIYGILVHDLPIMVANGASLCLSSYIVYLMLRYRKRS